MAIDIKKLQQKFEQKQDRHLLKLDMQNRIRSMDKYTYRQIDRDKFKIDISAFSILCVLIV